MAEHPILFSAPMIRAILDGRKTVTRRIVKDRYIDEAPPASLFQYLREACPYGQAGDALWVRETCSAEELIADTAADRALDGLDGVRYAADGHFEPIKNTAASADAWCALHAYRGLCGAIVPAIHMPRWASRITLRIKSVRVERVQDISNMDALSEGISEISKDSGQTWKYGIPDRDGLPGTDDDGWPWQQFERSPRDAFRRLWDGLNAKRGYGWETTPWVWRVEFERVEQKP